MADLRIREYESTIEGKLGQLPLFVAKPDDAATHGAVIVVHEIFGLNEHIRNVARRFARHSLVAYAPDLFAAADNLPNDRNDIAAMRGVWQGIPDNILIQDLQTVFRTASADKSVDPNRIGTIGFCMGGAIAYIFAASTPKVSWVADYYGRIYYPQLSENKSKHPIDYTDTLQCPVVGIYAGIDELITSAQIEEFAGRARKKQPKSVFKTYPNSHHAFFNDEREFYDAESAEDAWKLTMNFIGDAEKTTA